MSLPNKSKAQMLREMDFNQKKSTKLRPSAAALPVGTLLKELVFGAENPAQQQGNFRAEKG